MLNNRFLTGKLKLYVVSSTLLLILLPISLKGQINPENFFSELKIMTFNIRYGSADDGENSWRNRKQILLDVIKDFNPDLLSMQEALKFQLDELLEQMPNYSFAGVGREDGKISGEYSPILFSKERFELDTTETFWFSDTPNLPGSKTWGNNFTRICTWAKLLDKVNQKYFHLLNLHLDHQSIPSRIKSAEALIAKIKNFAEILPTIITGDFNTVEEEETIKIIKSFGLIDTYRILHVKSGNEGTFNDFKGIDTNDKIDYIFISRDFRSKESEIIKTNVNGKYPSDHFPVTAILEFAR